MQARMQSEQVQFLQIHSGSAALEGELIVPDAAQGIVLFAHGSGASFEGLFFTRQQIE